MGSRFVIRGAYLTYIQILKGFWIVVSTGFHGHKIGQKHTFFQVNGAEILDPKHLDVLPFPPWDNIMNSTKFQIQKHVCTYISKTCRELLRNCVDRAYKMNSLLGLQLLNALSMFILNMYLLLMMNDWKSSSNSFRITSCGSQEEWPCKATKISHSPEEHITCDTLYNSKMP